MHPRVRMNYNLTMKRIFISLISIAVVAVGCNSESADESVKEDMSTEQTKTNPEEDIKGPGFEYDESIQGQWDDIVYRVKSGDMDNLAIYIDKSAPTFSEQEWSYVDISSPEFKEAFDSYKSFYDLPEATYFGEGARVVTVHYVYEEEGMSFESSEMIFLVERDGMLWIIGSAMAG